MPYPDLECCLRVQAFQEKDHWSQSIGAAGSGCTRFRHPGIVGAKSQAADIAVDVVKSGLAKALWGFAHIKNELVTYFE